jgi:hypothetical protein
MWARPVVHGDPVPEHRDAKEAAARHSHGGLLRVPFPARTASHATGHGLPAACLGEPATVGSIAIPSQANQPIRSSPCRRIGLMARSDEPVRSGHPHAR